MSEISAEKVKELREKSGAGMLDCKRALTTTGGDLEKAIDLLRKEGVVKAAKKAGRATSEGLIGFATNKKVAALVEVNCETDFVARTDQFQQFINTVAEQIVISKPKDLEAFLASPLAGATVQEKLSELISKVGENMGIKRINHVEVGAQECVSGYLHAGAKIGVLVKLKGEKADEALGRDIAMHVAAMSPSYVSRSNVPQTIIDREKEIAKASPDLQGKPAAILDKILDGKVNRFFSENCLLEQQFIKDSTGKKSVGDYIKSVSPGTEIVTVTRFQVGEEVR